MSKPVQTDISTDPSANKHPRLDLQEQIQRGIDLATQICHAVSKDHFDSKDWAVNQAAVNELLHTFENMQEKTVNASESIQGLIAAQIKVDVKMRMDKLQARCQNHETIHSALYNEIRIYLRPSQTDSRENIVEAAIEKMEGISGTDLTARVTEASEGALLEVFHEGIDKQMRGYMN